MIDLNLDLDLNPHSFLTELGHGKFEDIKIKICPSP